MLKPDFRIYKTETTEYWRTDISSRAGRLFAVYVFDANRHVHCCELTPSYEMWYVGPTWTGGERCEDESQDEAEQQRLFEDILEGDVDSDDMCVWARDVNLDECEPLTVSDDEWEKLLHYHHGDADEAWKATLETVLEHCRRNGVIY